MKIGILGYGNMAAALAFRWIGKHRLFVGGRDPAKAKTLAETLGHAAHGSLAEATAFVELIVLATRHDAVFEAIDGAGGASAFAGNILIDINKPVDVSHDEFLAKSYDGKSLSEVIA